MIARLPRAMMAALSTAIGRWVITRSSLPLHLASKIPEPPLKTRRAVITRSFFVSTAFNLNRPSPLLLHLLALSSLAFRSIPLLSFPFPLLESSAALSLPRTTSPRYRSSLLIPFAPRDRNPLLYPTDHDSSSKTTCYYGGSPVMDVPSMDAGTRGCNNLLVLRPSN